MRTIQLDADCTVATGSLPSHLVPDPPVFDALWALHPEERSELVIHGRPTRMPRWDRAYGKDYRFANQTAVAHRVPEALEVYLVWAKENVDDRLNGLFVNWHDGSLRHYHGKHRDSTKGLVPFSPIVTISLGEERVFRMRPYPRGAPGRDLVLENGTYVVMPWITNQRWTHEIPRLARYRKRRISVTVRAFA